VEAYQKRLGSAHKETCTFYQSEGIPENQEEHAIPVYMASMLDSEFVSLIETTNPIDIMKNISYPQGEIPDLRATENGFMQKAIDKMQTLGVDSNTSRLAITGWSAVSRGKTKQIECSVCLAHLRARSSPSEAKRARREVDPIKAHRYYCPFVSGFTEGAEPLWKRIAAAVLSSDDDSSSSPIIDADDHVDSVRQLLSKGISSKKLKDEAGGEESWESNPTNQ